jgi:hypothetical protein
VSSRHKLTLADVSLGEGCRKLVLILDEHDLPCPDLIGWSRPLWMTRAYPCAWINGGHQRGQINRQQTAAPGLQIEACLQRCQRVCYNLLRNQPKLSVKGRMLVRSHAALERLGCGRPVKESGSDAQGTNPVPGNPSRTDFVYFANHVISSAL